jgi:hypothetical protein
MENAHIDFSSVNPPVFGPVFGYEPPMFCFFCLNFGCK